mmetsp:Transcript_13392/g.30917  ORF Transcript_13392/g.30917 Transcript_13392/m.30917 type:complete len:337 (+) Transcript_13392:45-1055(+)
MEAQKAANKAESAKVQAEVQALRERERAAETRAAEVAAEVSRLQAEQKEKEEAERAQAEVVRRLAGEMAVKEERTRQMEAEVERLMAEKDRAGGSAEERGKEVEQLRREVQEVSKAKLDREGEVESMRREMEDVKKREATQMSIITRLKKEQSERDKKDKVLKDATEEASVQRGKVEEQLASTLLEMEALREAKAARADALSDAPERQKKVVLSPTEQAAFTAARHGRDEELSGLLESVHVNALNDAGNTLLITAAQNNQQKVVKELHNRGADLNSQNRLGQTALHFAFAFGYTELGKWLVKKGAATSLKNSSGMTCYEGLSPQQPAMPFVQRYVK